MRIPLRSGQLAILLILALLSGCNRTGENENRPLDGATSVLAQREPTKWALLIGIDRYMNASPLMGCVNDVKRMKTLLVGKFDFPLENVLVLTNEKATHSGIVKAIQTHLIANARENDIVVVHYSGHGSQMKDVSGDEREDGWDETLVPHDSRQGDVYDISDDEINGLLGQLSHKTRNITFIFDSCHSGTASRGSAAVRNIPPDDRDPPSAPPYATSVKGADPVGLRQEGANFAFLAGAQSDQLANEYFKDGKWFGAFSYFLSEALSGAKEGYTYRDVMDNVKASINMYYPQQNPQIQGVGVDSYIFGDTTILPDIYFLASPVAKRTVMLSSGEIHGATDGSIYAVYPPGTKRFVTENLITKVKITETFDESSMAQIIDDANVVANSRVVEIEHAYGDQKLLLHYLGLSASPTLQTVKAELDALNNIEARPGPYGYEILLRELNGKIVFEAADTTMLSRPVSVNDANAAGAVVKVVQEWARWFNLRKITNPASAVVIDVILSQGRELFDGDEFDCIVTNRSNRSLFISVLNFSSNGSVSLVHPIAGFEALPPKRTTRIPLEAFVPADRNSVRDVLKVFATSKQVDLLPLTQPPIRAREMVSLRRSAMDPLECLLAQASVGVRGTRPRVKLADWTVVQQRFVIKKR